MLRSKLLRLAVVGFIAVTASTFAFADLAAFCTGAPPTTPGPILDIYNSQCPAYLQSQFAGVGAANQSTAVTTALAQQSSQESIASGYAAMIKAPPSQSVPTDVSNLSMVIQVQDARQTVRAAQQVGANVSSLLGDKKRVLLISATDLQAYANGAADVAIVRSTLDNYTKVIGKSACTTPAASAPVVKPAAAPAKGGGVKPAIAPVLAVYAVGALFSAGANIASSFQPSLVATGASKSVQDPTMLMTAGLFDGLGDNRKFLGVRTPVTTSENAIVKALDNLRKAVVDADAALSNCSNPATDIGMKEGLSEIADANAYVASLTVVSATSPISLLTLAARQQAISDANYTYFLVMVRDVSAGGIATIKPNWYSSLQLNAGAVDGITYQLTNFKGNIVQSNFVAAQWSGKYDLEKWSTEPGKDDPIVTSPQHVVTAAEAASAASDGTSGGQ